MPKTFARLTTRLLLAACLALPLFSGPAAALEIKEGRDYAVLPQAQATESKGKIEVTEFFWYGCPHCYEFEPTLNSWLKNKPADVVFRRVPADFGRWTAGAKLYYALEMLGVESKLHQALFDAIHRERLNFNNPAAVGKWLETKGVERKRFDEMYNSFAVQSKVARAQQLTRAHGLNGVPAIIVDGRYLTNNVMANGFEALPGIINALIAKARTK